MKWEKILDNENMNNEKLMRLALKMMNHDKNQSPRLQKYVILMTT